MDQHLSWQIERAGVGRGGARMCNRMVLFLRTSMSIIDEETGNYLSISSEKWNPDRGLGEDPRAKKT